VFACRKRVGKAKNDEWPRMFDVVVVGCGNHLSWSDEVCLLHVTACRKRVGKAKNDEWLRMFDVVVVGCGKPGFFNERRPLFAVEPRDGSLRNTDNGAPIIPLGEEDLPDDVLVSALIQGVICIELKACVAV
jgi:hypothetical protein